jgi:hypothetical protein
MTCRKTLSSNSRLLSFLGVGMIGGASRLKRSANSRPNSSVNDSIRGRAGADSSNGGGSTSAADDAESLSSANVDCRDILRADAQLMLPHLSERRRLAEESTRRSFFRILRSPASSLRGAPSPESTPFQSVTSSCIAARFDATARQTATAVRGESPASSVAAPEHSRRRLTPTAPHSARSAADSRARVRPLTSTGRSG